MTTTPVITPSTVSPPGTREGAWSSALSDVRLRRLREGRGAGTGGRGALLMAHLRSWRARVVARPGERDRGDVPGWVLITLMTAGLVVAIWAIAGPALTEMFDNALQSVKGP